MILSNCCILIMGQSPDSKTYNKSGLGLPFYQGNADFGEKYPIPKTWCTSPKKIARSNDILLSVRAPIGALNIANEDCCIGRGLAAIRSKDNQKLLNDYLYMFLSSKKELLINSGTGTTFNAIGKTVIENLELTIPPIKEQERIIACILKIRLLIKSKKEQIIALDELIKSRFVEMFEKGNFLETRIDNVCILKSGATLPKSVELSNGEILYCKVSDMNLPGNEKYMNFSKTYVTREIASKTYLPANTVIFPKRGGAIGTNKKRILSCDTCVDLNIMGVIPNMRINTQYLFQYFQNINLVELCDGSTIPQLNNKNIGPLMIKVPPILLQNEFAEFVKKVDQAKSVVQKQIDDLQELFDSKMDEYFG